MPSEQDKERQEGGRMLCEAEAVLRAEQESERRAKEAPPKQTNNPVRIFMG